MKLTSSNINGQVVKTEPKIKTFSASLEGGKRFTFGDNEQWLLEPKAELISTWSSGDNLSNSAGGRVHYDSAHSLLGSLGMTLGYQCGNIQPYLRAAVLHEFDGKNNIRLDNALIKSDPSGTRGLIGAGLNAKLTDNTSLYFDVAWESGGKLHSVGGNVGLRLNW